MGKKYKKKVQWRQLSLNELQQTSGDQEGEECEEEEEGEGGSLTPTQDSGCPYPRPYPQHPHHPHPQHQFPPPHHFSRRGAHHHAGGGYYYRNNFDKRFDRRGGFENIRNLESRGPYKPSFYDRHYQYDNNKYCGRPPYCGERGGYKFGFSERGRRPFRPYGRPGFFPKGFPGHQFPDGRRNTGVEEYFDQEEEEEEWEDGPASEEQQQQSGSEAEEKPSQPVHTVMINNEEYTKIQTPRQEVIFKKSSLDRRQDSLDQSSIAGSTTSASGSSSTTGAADGTLGGTGDQAVGDQESVSGSLEDNPSVAGDDPEQGVQDHIFEDPTELFVNESGGPPLAGVVMQQAYPGGPMYTIPVHWTPFIDPTFIPGETALTPLDPAFTHVIDPKSLPIDPVHILPVQHDAAGCPVQVQVKVDSNGVPIQIEPSAFTVSLNSLPQHHQGEPEPAAAATTSAETPSGQHMTEEHAARHSKEAVNEEEEEEEVKEREESEVAEAQDTLNEPGETLVDKEDKLEGKAETKDSKEKEEGEAKDEVAASTTQEKHRQSTSADTSAQSSSCAGKMATGKNSPPLPSPPAGGGEERGEGVEKTRKGGKGRNEECEVETPQGAEEQERPVPTGRTQEAEGRKEEYEEEEEEEEEEEDMLTKESEESSDSSDSQYASMSESSSTPTTPSGELTDPHETPTATHATQAASSDPAKHPQDPEADSHHSQQKTAAVSGAGGASSEDESRGDRQTDKQKAGEGGHDGSEATPKISQGYVMVPILTPYYDPSVLYGYPVVVTNQQQHVVVPSQQHPQPSPPPQQQHHNYSKKKKKKYQRRRPVDAPPAGTYLDPQLYTGEPFVATPGGYVVPFEAAASVCHIHGIQYVTPTFHQRLPDEGFVSLQHSPYLPDVAADPPTAEAQAHEGTNSQSDTARTVFSDLQDTERQQIQEILQEHAKVGKTDSTESSDSGVSESEEAPAAEASSDELDTSRNASSTQTTPDAGTNQDDAIDTVTSTPRCQEEDVSSTPEVKEFSELSTQHNTVTAELCSASVQADVDLNVIKESQACQTELSVSEDQTQCEVILVQQSGESFKQGVTCSEKSTEHISEPITADTETRDHQTEEQPASLIPVAEKKDIISVKECNGNTSAAEANEDNSQELEVSSECEASGESSVDSSIRKGAIHIFAQETEETRINDTSVVDSEVDNQKSIASLEIDSECYDELIKSPSIEYIDSSSTFNENVTCKSEGVSLEENSKVDKDVRSEVNDTEKITLKENYEERDDNNLSRGRLKDLKVTEAVTRWIREVTPEKAFTLSEKIQSRLLADQESNGEMDTEDEIATETKPNTVLEPKNVKGNPFVAPSNESPVMGVDGCSKRVALINKFRGTTPDTFEDYDGSSTISNLSTGHLYSEASSCPVSVNQSFDEAENYAENPEMYDPSAYTKYYQLGIEIDEIAPTATPSLEGKGSHGATPSCLIISENNSECGSEDIDSVPHKYDVSRQYTETSPLSLATEILKAEKVIQNMAHIAGEQESLAVAEQTYGNPDLYLKHYDAISHSEVSDSGVQSEDSSDETEGRSSVSSSGVGSSLASTPAVSPAHHLTGRPPLQPYPLKNLSVGEGPVPCKTVCCAVM